MIVPGMLPFDVPVEPDAGEATQWLVDELAKPVYQAAKPTFIDMVAKAIQDWIFSLRFGDVQGPPALGFGVIIAIVVVGLVVAFIIFGVPRLNRRSSVSGVLFGQDDDRNAAAMRRDAAAAASRGDYDTAVAEMFRAIARGMAERTLVSTSPGTTAHDFGARAGVVFPALSDSFRESAAAFDGVRYLGRSGSAEQYERMAALERQARDARPVLESVTA